MNRTCAIQHEPGYHRTQGEETNTCMKPLYLMCNLRSRMGSREVSTRTGVAWCSTLVNARSVFEAQDSSIS
jgi:hypothetical protein